MIRENEIVQQATTDMIAVLILTAIGAFLIAAYLI